MRVATKYVNLTRDFFSAHGITDYRIVESAGATEGAPAAGTAELIVDITSSGATLAANGLKVVEDGVILRSQANLVAARSADWNESEHAVARIVLDRIAGADARARIPGGAHALCRLQRRAAGRGARALRRRRSVRRTYLVRHADAALPARARACARHLPARQGRRRGDGLRTSITCSRATIRSTPSSKPGSAADAAQLTSGYRDALLPLRCARQWTSPTSPRKPSPPAASTQRPTAGNWFDHFQASRRDPRGWSRAFRCALLAVSFGAMWITVVGLKSMAADFGGVRSAPSLATSLAWLGTLGRRRS